MSWASIEDAMTLGTGIERPFKCHVHGDKVASASINSVTGLWVCYSCGARGKYDQNTLTDTEFSVQIRALLERLSYKPRPKPESLLDRYTATGPGKYWLTRFSEEICVKHRLGYDHQSGCAVIPMRDEDGELLGIISRPVWAKTPRKYSYPYQVKISEHMYNFNACTGDYLVITEGATDTIAADEVGWGDALATYRNGLSHTQAQKIIKYAPKGVFVAYDQDAGGERGFQEVVHRLGSRMPVYRLSWEGYKDLAEIPVETRREMFNSLRESLDEGSEE